jgi:DNA replicative helicase MCM subunit Mcm2 (Cdc46/Mcm family)
MNRSESWKDIYATVDRMGETIKRLSEIELIARKIHYARIGMKPDIVAQALDELDSVYRRQEQQASGFKL